MAARLGVALSMIALATGRPDATGSWMQHPVVALAGRGDVLAAATRAGVLFWDLSSGRPSLVGPARGLPSSATFALALAEREDELLVATANGLGRGWTHGRWRSALAATPFYSCMALPGVGWIAGGDRGKLVSWRRDRIESLYVPTWGSRVIGLAYDPALLQPKSLGLAGTNDQSGGASLDAEPPGILGAPSFPIGIVAALDNDGIWILRSTGSWTRWLKIGTRDGLPSERTLC